MKEYFGISAGKGSGVAIVTVNDTVTEITSITNIKGVDLFPAFKADPRWEQGQHLMLNKVKDMMAENAKPKVWEL